MRFYAGPTLAAACQRNLVTLFRLLDSAVRTYGHAQAEWEIAINAFPFAILVAGILAASAALAAPVGGAPTGTPVVIVGGADAYGPGDHNQGIRKQHAIFALLKEGKRIQIADGGRLTEAHRVELQRKFNSINAGNY
jgi:hypothetical protein